jgi:hypothetical protein
VQQSGEYRIGAPIAAVWQALNDPEVLARCIEGCQSMERTGDNAFRAVVKVRIGPVSAAFTGDVAMTDIDAPHGCTLSANAKGGPAGFGKGVAHVRLAEDGAASTTLSYDVEGSVGGKLAQVGQRLIDGAARKMADDFFAAFGEAVAPGASAAVPAPEAVPASGAATPSTGLPMGLRFWIMLAGALVVAAITAFWLSQKG